MREHAGKLVIVGCVGIAIGWFGRGVFGDAGGQRASANQELSRGSTSDPNTDTPVAAAPNPPAPRAQSETVGNNAGIPSVAATQGVESAGKFVTAAPVTGEAPSSNVASTPGNREGADSPQTVAATPAETLLNASSVKCDFSPGNSGFWHNQTLSSGTAAWQGGALVYDSIDIAAGTARITGNRSLTGSSTDGATVSAVPTKTALHLYGVAPNGTLSATTIFGAARNAAGHYNAVMSYHGPNLGDQESAQFYGTCDTTG